MQLPQLIVGLYIMNGNIQPGVGKGDQSFQFRNSARQVSCLPFGPGHTLAVQGMVVYLQGSLEVCARVFRPVARQEKLAVQVIEPANMGAEFGVAHRIADHPQALGGIEQPPFLDQGQPDQVLDIKIDITRVPRQFQRLPIALYRFIDPAGLGLEISDVEQLESFTRRIVT